MQKAGMQVYLSKMQVDCKYKEKCAGCQYLGLPLEEQHQLKARELDALLKNGGIPFNSSISVLSPGKAHLRDRVDLVWEQGALGLYEKNTRKVLDIDQCQQLTPELQEWLTEVRRIRWPIKKGSLRLRVGPQKQRGIWLDFANVDIKHLLEEGTLLRQLMALAAVEIGQRHKVLSQVNGQLKLTDPTPQVWFQTSIADQPVDLFCSIGTFTQPGIHANQVLTRVIGAWLDEISAKHILEFGSGIGNLSFPALGRSRRLTACEIDRGALAGFERSLEKLTTTPGFADIRQRVQIQHGDFQNRHPQNFGVYDTVLVNPPRSGLKEFLAPLVSEERKPKYFLYMSCFPESFVLDSARLLQAGYQLDRLTIVDQFPQTRHYEVLGLFQRKEF